MHTAFLEIKCCNEYNLANDTSTTKNQRQFRRKQDAHVKAVVGPQLPHSDQMTCIRMRCNHPDSRRVQIRTLPSFPLAIYSEPICAKHRFTT